ncbi:hypothetical protein BKM23_23230 [Pseudomonas syringae pv. syringae]|nr:hypothetical protein BKM23_23230 [Pseudomonas syringae pv. syringae]
MLWIMFVRFDEEVGVIGSSRASILVMAAMLRTSTGEKKVTPLECQFRVVSRILSPKMLNMAFMKNGPLAVSASRAVLCCVLCSYTVDAL